MSNAPYIESNHARKRLFVSYHHDNDRYFYQEFCRRFSDSYQIIEDTSVERTTGSNDAEYIARNLRVNYITKTDCTVLLCGMLTPWRKFVDWEIKATLDAAHGLVGINLPTNPSGSSGFAIVPDRFYDNIQSGYAVLLDWNKICLDTQLLAEQIALAIARPADLIRNSRPPRQKGG